MYNYESPIHTYTERVARELANNLDGEVITAVIRCGVSVDKDELIRALKYERDQYNKGYQDAIHDRDLVEVVHGRWVNPYINRYGHPCHCCSECGFKASYQDKNYCPNCGAKMDGDAE